LKTKVLAIITTKPLQRGWHVNLLCFWQIFYDNDSFTRKNAPTGRNDLSEQVESIITSIISEWFWLTNGWSAKIEWMSTNSKWDMLIFADI